METTSNKSSRAFDGLMALVSFVVLVAMIIFVDEWFWLALPFFLTYLVRSLNAM